MRAKKDPCETNTPSQVKKIRMEENEYRSELVMRGFGES